jgi:hypothetical protein
MISSSENTTLAGAATDRYLTEAREIALRHFPAEQVSDIPLIVVQVAQIIATCAQTHVLKGN